MPVATANEPEKVETFSDHLDEGYEFHFVKKLDEDIKLDPDASPKKEFKEPIELFETVESHVDKQLKLNDGKAKKIRRLKVGDDLDHNERRRHAQTQKKPFPLFRIFFLLTSLSAIALMCLNPDLRDELLQRSRREYNILMQGKEYCHLPLNLSGIMESLREQVVGQPEALAAIQKALQSHESVTSLVLHGPTGTGKTLVTQILGQKFPWQENVQILVHNPEASFDLSSITRRMSTCGQNLLVIDDLYPLNHDMLNVKEALETVASEKGLKLVLVFVFNVLKEGDFGEVRKGHSVVEFTRMTDVDLDLCMRRIEKELEVTLSQLQRESVRESVDVGKHGCKNVRSKVSLYA